MANVKITQLPSATTPLTGTEVFPLVQGTTTKQVSITGLFTSPVMSNPTLGVVGQADLINATGLPIASGVSGLGAGIATFLGTPSSANLRTAVTDETGTGSLVFANTPVLVAPNLGTPTFLVATNATGTAVGLTAGSAITNANLTGAVTSVGNATSLGSFTSAQLRTALTDETGAGSAVFATSPTITAPILNQINDTNNAQILGLSPTTSAVDYLVVKNGIGVGVPLHFYADGSSANIGLHIQPKGSGLVTISDGTDFNKGIRFRSSSSAASAVTLLDAVSTAGRVVTLPDATTTLVGRDTTDTLTNKTIAFSSNTFSGTLAIANGGTNASTAALAIENLLPAYAGNGSKGLRLNSGATALEWVADGGGTVTSVGGTGTVNGLTLTGTVTTSGNLTLGGTLSGIANSALTNSSITIGGTAIALGASSNALANDITVNGLTVGRGGGNGAANTAYGVSALALVGNSGDVGIGNNAGAAKTTTSDTAQSTFVGYYAGASVNTGTDNTFIGGISGRNTTTGTNNVSLGGYSFYTNVSGSYNVAIGKDSLRLNLASNNTAVGYQAGYSNQTGANNTALGYTALYTNTAANNTGIGYQSLYANTTGAANVGVGHNAAKGNTTGTQNNSLGFRSLETNSTGNYNNAFGTYAMYGATGSNNSAFGDSALYNTTGSSNVGIGNGALQANTTASNNTAVGYQAGYSNTTGIQSTAVGNEALYSNTTGNNTAVGHRAGYALTTGSTNTLIGRLSGSAITTGLYNNALGNNSLQSNVTASGNTAIGEGALFAATGGGNTAVGSFDGSRNASGRFLTTGTYNTFLGSSSGADITTGSKNVVLGGYSGNQGGLGITTSNNQTVISDGDGNIREYINSSGDVYWPMGQATYTNGVLLSSDATKIFFQTYNGKNLVINNLGNNIMMPQVYALTTGSAANMFIDSSGTLQRSTSSLKYKKNIQDAPYGLSDVLKLRAVTYQAKDSVTKDDKGEDVTRTANPQVLGGLIAEEVHAAGLTQFVQYAEDGTPDALAYGHMVSLCIKAIQELKAEFDAYKATHP